MSRAGLISVAAHALLALLLLFGHRWVGRTPLREADEPARIDIVLGEGGETNQPPAGAVPAPARDDPPPDAPPAEAQPASRPTAATPPVPSDAPSAEQPPALPPVLPIQRSAARTPATAPASPAAPPAVHLGDRGGRPHADLLDPDNARFRAATQDSGNHPPRYPRDAAARLEAGTVRLQLFIDPAGRVTNVTVVGRSGSASLASGSGRHDPNAPAAARRW